MPIRVTKTDGFKRLRSMKEALKITAGDLAGPVLVRLGRVHRAQELAIFASEGGTSAAGKWAPLSPKYAARKRKAIGRRKTLVLTGRTKASFTKFGGAGYIQRFDGSGESGGVFSFGAASDIGAAHFHGDPTLAPSKGAAAATIFSGVAKRLPARDMISKTEGHRVELRAQIAEWYEARVQQVIKSLGKAKGAA